MVIVVQTGMEGWRHAAVSFHHTNQSVHPSLTLIQLCPGQTRSPLLTMADFLALCPTLVADNPRLPLKRTRTSHCQSVLVCVLELPTASFSLSKLTEVEGMGSASCMQKAAGGTALAGWSMMMRERLFL
jgi:hypothetical protein